MVVELALARATPSARRRAISLPWAIRYTNMPSTGRKIRNAVQAAFGQPPMSWRAKTSLRTMIRHQNHITQRKNTNIVPTMSKKG